MRGRWPPWVLLGGCLVLSVGLPYGVITSERPPLYYRNSPLLVAQRAAAETAMVAAAKATDDLEQVQEIEATRSQAKEELEQAQAAWQQAQATFNQRIGAHAYVMQRMQKRYALGEQDMIDLKTGEIKRNGYSNDPPPSE